MRGLLKASTLLLAPALASALIKDPVESVPSVFITIDIPNGVHAPRPLTLRLDVEERDKICGPANIKINDNALTIASQGYAHGELALEDESTIDASWQVACVEVDSVPVEQIFSFTVHSIDGQTVPETSFDAYFRQTAPVFISDIEGASSVRRLTITEEDDVVAVDDVEVDDSVEAEDDVEAVADATPTDSPIPQTSEEPATETNSRDEELEAQLADLEFLRIQAFELEKIIRQKERAIHERFGDRVRPPPHHGPRPHTPLMDCTNMKCIIKSLTHEAKHTYHRVMGPGGFLHVPGGHHPPPPPPPHHGPGKGPRPPHHPEDPHHPDHPHPPPPPPPPHHPEEPHHPDHPPPPPPPHEPEDPHHPHRPPGHGHDLPRPPPFEPREFLARYNMTNDSYPQPSHGHGGGANPSGFPIPPFFLIVIGIIAVIYTLFALRNKGPCRKVYHHIRYGSRGDRRRGRTDTVGYIFHRRHRGGSDEERQAMIQHQRYGRIPEDETTMEQEIAQLREAANVVEGLVAAEEGRLRRPMVHQGRVERSNSMREMTQTVPPAPSPPPLALQPPTNPRNESTIPHNGSSINGSLYSPYEDSELPAYDYDQVDTSMVSDGFRIAPGATTYMGYVPSNVASNADDVLGDSKN